MAACAWRGRMACGGVTDLPSTPSATAPGAYYERCGFALLDLRKKTVISTVPFQEFSDAGHVLTRNPVTFAAQATCAPCGRPGQRPGAQRHRDLHLPGDAPAAPLTD